MTQQMNFQASQQQSGYDIGASAADAMSDPRFMTQPYDDMNNLGTVYMSEEQSLIDPNFMQGYFSNDFVGRNRDIVQKFNQYDIKKREVFTQLRDRLTLDNQIRRAQLEEERRQRLLEQRSKWDMYRLFKAQREKEQLKKIQFKRGCRVMLAIKAFMEYAKEVNNGMEFIRQEIQKQEAEQLRLQKEAELAAKQAEEEAAL